MSYIKNLSLKVILVGLCLHTAVYPESVVQSSQDIPNQEHAEVAPEATGTNWYRVAGAAAGVIVAVVLGKKLFDWRKQVCLPREIERQRNERESSIGTLTKQVDEKWEAVKNCWAQRIGGQEATLEEMEAQCKTALANCGYNNGGSCKCYQNSLGQWHNLDFCIGLYKEACKNLLETQNNLAMFD